MGKIKVKKFSGELVDFNIEKLKASLRRTKAGEELIQNIVNTVNSRLYDGITTKEIYQMAFKMLNKSRSRSNASRYKLKKAIMELGPSGFPFEKFVAAIIKEEGYETEVGVIVEGHCVTHEVDVVVKNDHKHIMVECKYHNQQGRVNDVKIPLYIKSRFLDIEKEHKKEEGNHFIHEQWIYTNTRFSSEAIKYGECAGLKLVSWDYPHNNSLSVEINKHGLFPITTLTTLSKKDIEKLLEKGYVLCRDICNNPNILTEAGIDRTKHKKIMQNAKELSEYYHNNQHKNNK